jgi:hypothetical protein
MSRQATEFRRRVVNRLYRLESTAATNAEGQHWHFCREIVRRALDGWKDPWTAAHYYTFGLSPDKYRVALAARRALELWEVSRAPMVERCEVGRQTTGKGSLYPMPTKKKPVVEEPLFALPAAAAK